jgi:hypothetical protein
MKRHVQKFLGPFAKLWRATISFVLSVCSHEITRLPLDVFSWNLIFENFSKICRKIKVSLTSYKKKRYFTWRHIYVYDSISLIFFRITCMRQTWENQNTLFMLNNVESRAAYEIMCKNLVQSDRPDVNMIRCMPFACLTTKVTDTHWEYVMLYCSFHGNNCYENVPQCYVYTFIACLVSHK